MLLEGEQRHHVVKIIKEGHLVQLVCQPDWNIEDKSIHDLHYTFVSVYIYLIFARYLI